MSGLCINVTTRLSSVTASSTSYLQRAFTHIKNTATAIISNSIKHDHDLRAEKSKDFDAEIRDTISQKGKLLNANIDGMLNGEATSLKGLNLSGIMINNSTLKNIHFDAEGKNNVSSIRLINSLLDNVAFICDSARMRYEFRYIQCSGVTIEKLIVNNVGAEFNVRLKNTGINELIVKGNINLSGLEYVDYQSGKIKWGWGNFNDEDYIRSALVNMFNALDSLGESNKKLRQDLFKQILQQVVREPMVKRVAKDYLDVSGAFVRQANHVIYSDSKEINNYLDVIFSEGVAQGWPEGGRSTVVNQQPQGKPSLEIYI